MVKSGQKWSEMVKMIEINFTTLKPTYTHDKLTYSDKFDLAEFSCHD